MYSFQMSVQCVFSAPGATLETYSVIAPFRGACAHISCNQLLL